MKDNSTNTATIYINHKTNSISPNNSIVPHNSDTSSSASVQKLNNTCARMREAETFPICPKCSNTIAPDSKRRHRKCLTCRHNRLDRVGIFTSEFTSQKVKFISKTKNP